MRPSLLHLSSQVRLGRSRGAFDLVEIALYLTVALLIFIGGFSIFSYNESNEKVTQNTIEFDQVSNAIKTAEGGSSGYLDVGSYTISGMANFPPSWIEVTPQGPLVINAYGGWMYAYPGPNNDPLSPYGSAYVLGEVNLPQQACIALATQSFGSDYVETNINGFLFNPVLTSGPPTLAQAQAACEYTDNTNEFIIVLN